jgi:hypothetical protein
MGIFCSGRFANILLGDDAEQVGRIFVGETDLKLLSQTLCDYAFASCARRLMKLTPDCALKIS